MGLLGPEEGRGEAEANGGGPEVHDKPKHRRLPAIREQHEYASQHVGK